MIYPIKHLRLLSAVHKLPYSQMKPLKDDFIWIKKPKGLFFASYIYCIGFIYLLINFFNLGSNKMFPDEIPNWLRKELDEHDKNSKGEEPEEDPEDDENDSDDNEEDGDDNKSEEKDKKDKKDKKDNKKENDGKKGDENVNKITITPAMAWAYGSMLILFPVLTLLLIRKLNDSIKDEAITWQDLKKDIIDMRVERIIVNESGHSAFICYRSGEKKLLDIPDEERFIERLEGFQSDSGFAVIDYIPIIHKTPGFLGPLITTLLPFAVFAAIFLFIRGRIGKIGGGSGVSLIFIYILK